ncbi:MAG: phosphoribosyltransferase [Candidatus Yanofskybacteria bacterium]|nr:phosphoribosyltransferase [Candidatus Yanofskybacteria bacterium]
MKEVLQILKKTGALIPNGHFVGVSGRHLDTYITKDALLPHTAEVSKIAKLIAEKAKNLKVDAVVGPALGGIILSQWVAHHLSRIQRKKILSFYTEKTNDAGQAFTRGYDERVKGQKLLVVEDTVTTGGSAIKVVNAVKQAGGKVAKIIVITNRDPKQVNSKFLGVSFSSLCNLSLASYDPKDCPMCKAGVPVNIKLGHGKKFLESQK